MNPIDERLKVEAGRAAFSEERHRRLLGAIAHAPVWPVERPLRTPRDLRYAIGVAIAVVLVAASAALIERTSRRSSERAYTQMARRQDFGAPVRMAHQSVENVQGVATRMVDMSALPFIEPADHAYRFFVDQISLTRSLAVTPPAKPPA